MIWWHWVLVGFALLAAEVFTPGGFYLLLLGCAALAVGALVGAGLMATLWMQWLLFSVLSIVSLLMFRGPLLARLKSHEPAGEPVDSLIGETAISMADLAPGAAGKAELRGTTWSAINAGRLGLTKGQRTRVQRVDGLTLWITGD